MHSITPPPPIFSLIPTSINKIQQIVILVKYISIYKHIYIRTHHYSARTGAVVTSATPVSRQRVQASHHPRLLGRWGLEWCGQEPVLHLSCYLVVKHCEAGAADWHLYAETGGSATASSSTRPQPQRLGTAPFSLSLSPFVYRSGVFPCANQLRLGCTAAGLPHGVIDREASG